MKKVKWISRSLVDAQTCIGLCLDEKAFKNELRRLKVPKAERPSWLSEGKNGKVHFFKQSKGHNQCCLVCIGGRKGRKRSEIDGLLVHEAVHVWQHIREDIGDYEPSSEFEAYSIQNIAQRLMEELR